MLLYDSLIGQKNNKIFFEYSKSSNRGLISYPGYYLNNGYYHQNIETSAKNIQNFYDTSILKSNTEEYKKSLNLLGYSNLEYLDLKQNLDKTKFGFWKGFIQHKGTNYSIEAFANSVRYKSIQLDEYWAYKKASYGDFRADYIPDMKIYHSDSISDKTRYVFLEPDDKFIVDVNTTGNYDIPDYSQIGYDVPLYLSSTNKNNVYEWFDARGSYPVKHNNETRWYQFNDLNQFQYFELKDTGSDIINVTEINQVFQFNKNKNLIRADVFELIDMSGVSIDEIKKSKYNAGYADEIANFTYYEAGEYSTTSTYFREPSFVRLNHSTIKITNPSLVGKKLLVRWFEPDPLRYGPIKVIDYVNKSVTKDDIIFWDPARGIHNHFAMKQIDIIKNYDPARYTHIKNNTKSINNEVYNSWGSSNIGTIWWETNNLNWKSYSDTKIYPELNDRISQWGSISDYSSMNVYQWIESDKLPSSTDSATDFSTSPEPAIKKLLSRTRKWFYRPMVYLYSQNPQQSRPDVFRGNDTIRLSNNLCGDTRIIFESTRLVDNGSLNNDTISLVKFENLANKNIDKQFKPIAIATHDKLEKFTIGSSISDIAPVFFNSLEYDNFKIDINPTRLLELETSSIGKFTLSFELNPAGDWFIKLTCEKNNHSEVLKVLDTPVDANSRIAYTFDKFGLTISCFNKFGHNDTWGGNTAPLYRKQSIAQSIGNNHDIFIRSYVDAKLLNGAASTWNSCNQAGQYAWVAFNTPEVRDFVNDFQYPNNNYDVQTGDYLEINNISYLNKIILSDQENIKNNPKYQQSYRYSFAPYIELTDSYSHYFYNDYNVSVSDFCTVLSIPNDILYSRVELFLNDTLVNKKSYTIKNGINNYKLILNSNIVVLEGSKFTIRIKKITPSKDELDFDPVLQEIPTNLVQYKHAYDYVEDTRINSYGTKETKYYYWAKNIDYTIGDHEYSIKQLVDMLLYNRTNYAIMQVLKHKNQYDGRTNRYGMLIINELHKIAPTSGRYKLRINNKRYLKNDDQDINLKNVHIEWELIHRMQNSKIPEKLWYSLTDSLCRITPIGSDLPSKPRQLYDTRNSIKSSYGFDDGQLFANVGLLKETIKYTIKNTKIVNFDGAPDFINIDINNLNQYFVSEDSIRILMNSIWNTSKPSQINEIFFNCLNDALVENTELTNIFKTSYITIQKLKLNV